MINKILCKTFVHDIHAKHEKMIFYTTQSDRLMLNRQQALCKDVQLVRIQHQGQVKRLSSVCAPLRKVVQDISSVAYRQNTQ